MIFTGERTQVSVQSATTDKKDVLLFPLSRFEELYRNIAAFNYGKRRKNRHPMYLPGITVYALDPANTVYATIDARKNGVTRVTMTHYPGNEVGMQIGRPILLKGDSQEVKKFPNIAVMRRHGLTVTDDWKQIAVSRHQ